MKLRQNINLPNETVSGIYLLYWRSLRALSGRRQYLSHYGGEVGRFCTLFLNVIAPDSHVMVF